MRRFAVLVLILLGVANAPSAFAWDTYKNGVPDVNKPDRDGDGQWPDPGDNSCWIAVASNLLAGSGYGEGGDASARGDYIYTKMAHDLGWTSGGRPEWAINYWLNKYAKNPNAGEDYKPFAKYTDVTAYLPANGHLTRSDYSFLLGELERCQYVGIDFRNSNLNHTVTLVGGNAAGDTGNSIVVHDSDDGVDGAHDDPFTSTYDQDGNWFLGDYDLEDVQLYAYEVLCPGLNKPWFAAEDYDVAYFRQTWNLDRTDLLPDFQEAGMLADLYADPMWSGETSVLIGNKAQAGQKSVWLLVDYLDRDPLREVNMLLRDDRGNLWSPSSIVASKDGGQLMFEWNLDYQPAWEEIIFPSEDYRYLAGNVKDWNLTTHCVPGPAAVLAFALGLLVSRRRRSG